MSETNTDNSLINYLEKELEGNKSSEDDSNIPTLGMPEKKNAKKSKMKKPKVVTLMKIGAVAEFFKINTSVLRFWEEEFPELRPTRTETGQRLYTPKDIALIKKIKKLLHGDGLTISGAKKILSKSPLPKGNENSRISLGNIPVLPLHAPKVEEQTGEKQSTLSSDDKAFLKEVEQELLAIQKLLTSD